MCGIAGSIGDTNLRFVHAMIAALEHRGPDEQQVWHRGDVAFAHTRLAIVGLGSAGSQPFHSRDGHITVVYNGEIYNHEDLRERHGISAGPTDGAILPELWQIHGTAMFGLLRGMYAIAVHDAETGETTLCVDPLGMKTLYVAHTDGATYFSSESMPMAHNLGLAKMQQDSHRHFDDWGCLPLQDSGVQGVARLTPGTMTTFAPGHGPHGRRDSIDLSTWRLPRQDWTDVTDCFIDSVDKHLMSDVPTALLLSAGVDSAAIAWAAAELGVRLTCVTLDFAGGNDEAHLATRIAEHYGHEHMVIDSGREVRTRVHEYLQFVDRPSVDGLNTFIANRALSDIGIKVSLSGAGGDELLLGYPYMHRRGISKRLEPTIRRFATFLSGREWPVTRKTYPSVVDGLLRKTGGVARGGLSRDPRMRVTSARAHRPLSAASDRFTIDFGELRSGPQTTADLYTETDWSCYLAPMLLADADVFAMASGVEQRLPFVDLPLLSAVLNVSDRRPGKHSFVNATGEAILSDCLARPKTGFDVPFWSVLEDQEPNRGEPRGRRILQDTRHQQLDGWRETVWRAWSNRLTEGAMVDVRERRTGARII